MNLFVLKIGKYNKFVMALVGFAAVIGVAAFDGAITDAEAAAIVSAAITAGGVFGLRNRTLDDIQDKADQYKSTTRV